MYKPKLLAKTACTFIVGVHHRKKYTIKVCQAKVKFKAQKRHEWIMVTFSKVVLLYGNDIQ